ncbi:MAG TPA: hypothetical protein VF254_09235 [Gammaproteobacteria bacterium]
MKHFPAFVTFVFFLSSGVIASDEPERLFAPDNERSFAMALATSGDVMAVGSTARADEAFGGVYLYTRNESESGDADWSYVLLTASDGDATDRFGEAVAMDGGLLAVGAPMASVEGLPEAGAVYLFRREAGEHWKEFARLGAADPTVMAMFGSSIDVDDGRVIVGAPQADVELGMPGGAAYVFDCSVVCTQSAKLSPSTHVAGSRFGSSVAISGGFAAVGRTGEEIVYVYEHDGESWRHAQSLDPAFIEPAFDEGTGIGGSVLLDGNVLAIGAPHDDDPSAGSEPGWFTGVVHVYEHNGDDWVRTAVLSGKGIAEPVARFGLRIDLEDGNLAVTAGREISARVYRRDAAGAWSLAADFFIDEQLDPIPVAVSRERLLVGYPNARLGSVDEPPLVEVYALAGPAGEAPPEHDEDDAADQDTGGTGDTADSDAGNSDGGGNGNPDDGADGAGDNETAGTSGTETRRDNGGGAGTWLLVLLLAAAIPGRAGKRRSRS